MSIKSFASSLAITACFIFAVTGCQSTQTVEPPAVIPAPEVAEPGPPPERLAAQAALTQTILLIETEDPAMAAARLATIDANWLSDRERARYHLLAAELDLRAGDSAAAARSLARVELALLGDSLERAIAEAWQLALRGLPAQGAIRLMDAPPAAQSRQRRNDAIWVLAGRTPPFAVLALATPGQAGQQGEQLGWWQLREAVLVSTTLHDQARRVATWRQRHPDHPASTHLPRALRLDRAGIQPPTHIALMLPLTGAFGPAGRAARDGFIAAWLAEPTRERGRITVLDTASGSISERYQQAITGGADLIVGPLRRESVAELNALAPTLPVLALNQLPAGTTSANLAQLSLAIEDDASSLAAWLQESGNERLLILRGPHEWASRVQQALTSNGLTPADDALLPELQTVTENVGTAMLTTGSEKRHEELESLTGLSMGFTPRPREDIDAIVALVDAIEITALTPALRFHYADRIPVYAASQTLQNASDNTLRALEGTRVVQLPWALPRQTGRALMESAFELEGNPYAMLYALGADAFRLSDRIMPANRTQSIQLLGNTGALTVSPDGRVERRLARMRVENGQLVSAGIR